MSASDAISSIEPLLRQLSPLVRAGCAVHWLHPRSKRPIGDDWETKPVHSVESLRASYRDGMNTGVRLGEPSKIAGYYLQVIDVDIRVAERAAEALTALRGFVPEFETLPFVISGSGGESRHFHFLTDKPFRGRKLAHSADKITDDKGKQHWAWEVELFGTGKQVALPPSIHPDTGLEYRWGREFDFEDLEIGMGPIISSDRVGVWAPTAKAPVEDDDDGMFALLAAKPMGLTPREIATCLAGLPAADFCEDREGWLTVGMALHHEFQGSKAGLAVWNAFSKQSPKFDEADQIRVWKSFESKVGGTRMATLIKAAATARLKSRLAAPEDDYGDDIDLGGDSDDDEDEGDDLLGPRAGPAGIPADPDDVSTGTGGVANLDWVSLLDHNEQGAIKPTLHNVELMVRHDRRTAGLMQFNDFTQEVTLRGKPKRGMHRRGRKHEKAARQLEGPLWTPKDPVNGDLWKDPHDNAVRSIFEAPSTQGGYGVKVSDRDLKAAVNLVAIENHFHPVRDYLNGLVWDGVPRVDSLFVRYLGAEDTAYTRAVTRLTMLGAVVRVNEPGHKFDFSPILEGSQGKRKSWFIRVLAKSWFDELEGDFEDRKAMVEKMQGKWILELPELQGFNKHDVSTIKAFISAQSDKVRLAYERRSNVFDRQCIFIGSTNDSTYLRDETGGRRFWPIVCAVQFIDVEGLEEEVDQVWAEAMAIYRDMRVAKPKGALPLFITDAEAAAEATVKQEERRVENSDDVMAGSIEAWLERPMTDELGFDEAEIEGVEPVMRNETCCAEIWCVMLHRDLSTYGQAQQQQIGRALKKVPGWYQAGRSYTEKYGRQRVFRRNDSPLI